MKTLIIAEHDNQTLKVATLNAVAAAQAMGGDIDVLVVGSGCQSVADQAAAVPAFTGARNFGKPWLYLLFLHVTSNKNMFLHIMRSFSRIQILQISIIASSASHARVISAQE